MAFQALVEKQREFFLSGGTSSLASRKDRLLRLQKLLQENKEAIDGAIFKDLGRKQGEVDGALRELDKVLKNFEQWAQPTKYPIESGQLSDANDDMYLVPEPLGVVLVIGPWNFPLATTQPFIHALAAGNTIVLKPSELDPTFSTVITQLISKYFDEKEFASVEGGVAETTELLQQRFDHILYTGNPVVGKIIMAAAAKHLTPVTLELGGKNPLFVDESADLEALAKGVIKTKIVNAGQICISVDYIITTPSMKPKVIGAISQGFGQIGDLHKFEGYSRIVNERHFERLSALLKKTKGEIVFKTPGEPIASEKYLPVYLVDIQKDDELMKDEIFGPILPIITVDSFDEFIKFVKSHEKPLAAYIYTKDGKQVERVIRETSSGATVANDTLSQFGCGLPFGGVGNSGMGRLQGKWGFDTFTHEKPVLLTGTVGKGLDLKLKL